MKKRLKIRTAMLKIFSVRNILQFFIILTIAGQALNRNFYNVFLCILTLILFNVPSFIDRKLNIKLPSVLESVILIFIFSAEILGEIQSFYTIVPHWDTVLHTINGFLMAAIGFAMVDILNRSDRFHFNMSPYFVAFVAFCFSMTIGVLWEFSEFFFDWFFRTDMQKDFIVNAISSVAINPSGLNETVKISDITSTIINGIKDNVSVSYQIEGGYLDLGIIDTMKDLMVNCIGAIVFSVIGFFYIQNRGQGVVAKSFIPTMKSDEEKENEK